MRSFRVLIAAAAIAALSACGSSTPPPPPEPSGSFSPLASTSPVTTPTRGPISPPTTPRNLILLPPSCTKADGIYVARKLRNGAGGVSYDYWRLKSHTTCTLYGVPQVTLYDASGRTIPAATAGYGGWFGYQDVHPEPAVVGPAHAATVQIAKYRCDTTTDAPLMTAATVTLPLGPEAHSNAGTLHVKLSQPLPYCPRDEGNQDVHVAPIGYTGKFTQPYAVNMRSVFDPGGAPTWGSADMDGDGRPDTVIVSRAPQTQAEIEIHYANGSSTEGDVASGWPVRLQALLDLNADQTREILLAGTASPSETGYVFGDSGALVVQVLHGQPTLVSNGKADQWQLTLSRDGRGDLWAGFECRADGLVQSTALQTGQHGLVVTRVRWHIDNGHPKRVGGHVWHLTVPGDHHQLVDSALAATESHCAGVGTSGWPRGR